jgi:hypothetical protein
MHGERLEIRCSLEQRRSWEQAAGGQSLAQWVRMVLDREVTVTVERVEVAEKERWSILCSRRAEHQRGVTCSECKGNC